jgi:hypothetical protein
VSQPANQLVVASQRVVASLPVDVSLLAATPVAANRSIAERFVLGLPSFTKQRWPVELKEVAVSQLVVASQPVVASQLVDASQPANQLADASQVADASQPVVVSHPAESKKA